VSEPTQLVQILLPLTGPNGERFDRTLHDAVARELTERFGGVTAYTRAPATGLWDDRGRTVGDEIVVIEVMVDAVDPEWWAAYRRDLERRFAQSEVVVRAQPMRRL
jgi:hypothetical protein